MLQEDMEEAREMGKKQAIEKSTIKRDYEKMTEDQASDEIARVYESITQYAQWANTVLPKLRKMAGFEDAGQGTYREISESKDAGVLHEKMDRLTTAWMNGFYKKSMKNFEKANKLKEVI